jgi:hypothetical protein
VHGWQYHRVDIGLPNQQLQHSFGNFPLGSILQKKQVAKTSLRIVAQLEIYFSTLDPPILPKIKAISRPLEVDAISPFKISNIHFYPFVENRPNKKFTDSINSFLGRPTFCFAPEHTRSHGVIKKIFQKEFL